MDATLDNRAAPLMIRRRAPPALAGLVTAFVAYEERGLAMSDVVEAAALDTPVIFSLGTSFTIALGRAPTPADHQRSFAAGLFAGPVRMSSDGGAACIQVNFTPRGARRFLGLPMSELAGAMVAIDDLGDRALRDLHGRLADGADWAERLARVERFVLRRLADAPPSDPLADEADAILAARHGNLRVGALARRLGVSHRELIRRCRAGLGLGPKSLARILRFQRALALARGGGGWAVVAADAGYSDQAHFVRECVALAGRTPTEWRRAITRAA